MRLPIVLGLIAGAAFVNHASAAPTIFTDSTFSLSNYSSAGPLTTGGASFSFMQCNSCGNPGFGLQLAGTFPNAPVPPATTDIAADAFLNTAFLYTPSTQGAITSLSMSVDKNLGANVQVTGGGNTFHPLIYQDNTYYADAIPGPGLNCPTSAGCFTGYNTLGGSGLTAADFVSYDPATGASGTAHPDFNGDPIRFGLLQQFNGGGVEIITADYDNLRIAINAPEPASTAILGAGLLGLLGLRRKGAA